MQAGAEGTLLSGSGSSVFGVFKNREVCQKAAAQLSEGITGDIFMAQGLRQEYAQSNLTE